MLPKSYVIAKWVVYALATLALFALQDVLLDQLRLWGAAPFIYPMLPAVLASYEGLLPGPFMGFFTLTFTLTGLLTGLVGEKLLSPGPLCGLCAAAMGLLITGFARVAVQLLSGGGHLGLMAQTALREALATLPALAAVLPLYSVIHRRCAADY